VVLGSRSRSTPNQAPQHNAYACPFSAFLVSPLRRGWPQSFGKKMQYIDSHHKRVEFSAVSFRGECNEALRSLVFTGQNSQETVSVFARESSIAARISSEEEDFVLRKLQILDGNSWLTLDFERNPKLSRLVVSIAGIDFDDLDLALKELIGSRSVLYFRHHV
jgi:hypothetical protein